MIRERIRTVRCRLSASAILIVMFLVTAGVVNPEKRPAYSLATRSAADFTQITWTQRKSQPFTNSEGQGVVVDGKLYSFGGFDSTKPCCTPTPRSYVYDPVANTWTSIANLPFVNGGGATHHGVATDGTNIFIAGGYIANAARTGQIFGTKEVYRYNVASNTYTRLPNLPVERAAGRLEYLDGKLHYFAGTNKARTVDVGTHYVLNVAGGGTSWTTRTALPNPRHHMVSAVVDGFIYAIGGQHGHDAALVAQKDVHRYNPATNTWTKMASLPQVLSHAASTVLDGRIIVMGGEIADGKPVRNVRAYDPAANTWTSLTALPAARRSGVGGAIDGNLYYSGGNRTAITYRGVPVTGTLAGKTSPITDEPLFDDNPSGIEDLCVTEKPAAFELVNYPNPFNPSTRIRYTVPEAGHVRLSVYDVLGRRIAVLVNQRHEPGAYAVSFDAGHLPGGAYFYEIQAGSYRLARQMLLLK